MTEKVRMASVKLSIELPYDSGDCLSLIAWTDANASR